MDRLGTPNGARKTAFGLRGLRASSGLYMAAPFRHRRASEERRCGFLVPLGYLVLLRAGSQPIFEKPTYLVARSVSYSSRAGRRIHAAMCSNRTTEGRHRFREG